MSNHLRNGAAFSAPARLGSEAATERHVPRNTKRLLVAGLIALAVSVACGEPGGDIDPGGGTSIDPDAPVTSGPLPDDSVAPDPSPSYTEPEPGQTDLHPVGWESYNVEGGDLYISYWSGVEPCNVLDHVDVEYEARKIVVTLWEGHTPLEEDTACIEIALLKTTIIELDEPVGDRKVMDGSKRAQK